MKVRSVIPDPRSGTPVLVLEDFETGQKWLPLWIGVAEANSILMALQRTAVPRPMTHDLLRNLLHDLKARVLRIKITDLRENTFIATIYLQSAKETFQVDSRPSDAVALALRTDSPAGDVEEHRRAGAVEDHLGGGHSPHGARTSRLVLLRPLCATPRGEAGMG